MALLRLEKFNWTDFFFAKTAFHIQIVSEKAKNRTKNGHKRSKKGGFPSSSDQLAQFGQILTNQNLLEQILTGQNLFEQQTNIRQIQTDQNLFEQTLTGQNLLEQILIGQNLFETNSQVMDTLHCQSRTKVKVVKWC